MIHSRLKPNEPEVDRYRTGSGSDRILYSTLNNSVLNCVLGSDTTKFDSRVFISQVLVSGLKGSILYGQEPQGKRSEDPRQNQPNIKDYDELRRLITARSNVNALRQKRHLG